jgi:PBP1b-binding outer membrane lipoprotein LpoB
MNYKHFFPLILTFIFILSGCNQKSGKISGKESSAPKHEKATAKVDTLAYRKKLIALANGDTTGLWPIKTQPYPLSGAILPIMATYIRKKWEFWVNFRRKKCGED